MTTKTWNGSNAAFGTDAFWSPAGTPGAGDIAIINAGTVTATGVLAPALSIKLTSDAGNSPALALSAATIVSGDHVLVTGAGANATVSVASGTVVNRGDITLAGASGILNLAATSGTVLDNEGGISATGTASLIQSFGNGQIVNNGIISYRAPAGAQHSGVVFGAISGTGSIRVLGTVSLQLNASVSAGQNLVFDAGDAAVTLTALGAFQGSITGFANNDDLSAIGTRWASFAYQRSGDGGDLVFSLAGGSPVASLHFVGNYSATTSFVVSQSAGTGAQSITDIKVTDAEQAARFNVNDLVTNVISTEAGTVYSGPVSYLQYQYIYNGSNSVVLGANVNSVFLHGGTGSDALAVTGGSNVLDGGGGSNFLVGSLGTDGGTDTFFVDERGGSETWSTLVNFHVGDAVTIFGFKAGVSTLPLTATDGAAGYQGVTIHSEIGGAGTGVNGSVTFAGVSLSDYNTKFSSTTGNVGGADYISITRNLA